MRGFERLSELKFIISLSIIGLEKANNMKNIMKKLTPMLKRVMTLRMRSIVPSEMILITI